MTFVETDEERQLYEVWYKCGRSVARFKAKLAEMPGVKVPSDRSIYRRIEAFDWNGRAAEADRIFHAKQAEALATDANKFLKAQRQAGELLRLKGIKYLSGHDIEHSGRAIAAIKTGIDIERQALGLPEFIATVMKATNLDELNSIILNLESVDAGAGEAAGDSSV
jgi:hypothetical protein